MKYKCPSCGKKHDINIGAMMVKLSLEGKTPEELRERTRKATEASALARREKKLSTVANVRTGAILKK